MNRSQKLRFFCDLMKTPIILFPSEPFSPDEIDSVYASEYEAARAIGFKTLLYDHEELILGNIATACSKIPQVESNCYSLLRGWMLKDHEFKALYNKLEEKGYTLLTTPEGYCEAHYIPNSYQHIREFTPKSVWIEGDDMDNAWELYQTVSSQDNIIKDWVKSAKSQWLKGCFIPAKSNKERFDSIYQTFREERANLFNKGIVFREYIPLKEKGYAIDNHPAVEEIRLFCFKWEILSPPQKVTPDLAIHYN